MAVHALPRSRARAPLQTATVPPLVLGLALIAPAVDLLSLIQPGLGLARLALFASALAALPLVLLWARFPRTSWLFAACLAAVASLVLRAVGAEVAPLLSLLAILALGIGGAFSTVEVSLEAA